MRRAVFVARYNEVDTVAGRYEGDEKHRNKERDELWRGLS